MVSRSQARARPIRRPSPAASATDHAALIQLGLAACLWAALSGSVAAGPLAPPGGYEPVYYAGDNAAGYPQVTLTDIGDPSTEAILGPLTVRSQPNPFRSETALHFAARRGDPLRAHVYTVDGRLVREVFAVAGNTGRQEMRWDGRDATGRRMPPGVYLYRLAAGVRTSTGRLVLIR